MPGMEKVVVLKCAKKKTLTVKNNIMASEEEKQGMEIMDTDHFTIQTCFYDSTELNSAKS